MNIEEIIKDIERCMEALHPCDGYEETLQAINKYHESVTPEKVSTLIDELIFMQDRFGC